MRLQFLGPFNLNTGYGQAARGCARALRTVGADFKITVTNSKTNPLPEDLAPFRGEIDSPTHFLVHAPPGVAPAFRDPASEAQWHCMTTWETWNLPRSYTELLEKSFHSIIVPSAICQEQIAASPRASPTMTPGGTPIVVVPHVFENFGPEGWPSPIEKQAPGPYTFLWMGDWSERKNPIGMLLAYWHAFQPSDEVVLLMKLNTCDRFLLSFLRERCNVPLPRFKIVSEFLSQEGLIKLFQAADAFVTLSRGDAWNYPAFHALSQGLPIVYTENVGHEEYLDGLGAGISSRRTPVCSQTFSLKIEGNQFRADSIEPNGVNVTQLWEDPDLWEAAEAMRALYESRPPRVNRDLSRHFGYRKIGDKLMEALCK